MKVKVSEKNQVVIPKDVRKQVGIKPGQMLDVRAGKNGTVVLSSDPVQEIKALIDKYAGSIPRGTYGDDPAEYIRKMRDTEWRD